MPYERPTVSTEEIDRDPIGNWEIDLALHYADVNYEVEIDPDLLRIVFNTIQLRRTAATKLHNLVRLVTRETIFESRWKRVAMIGAIMKLYSHRKLVKAEADKRKRQLGMAVAPATKQTEYPFDPRLGQKDQRTMF